MNSSLKVRLVCLAVYSACFLLLSLLSQWAVGFSVLTPLSPALQAMKKLGVVGELFCAFHFPLSVFVPFFVAVMVCRALGFSLERRAESAVDRGVQVEETLPESVELRSYATKTVFRAFFWFYLVLSALALVFGLVLQARSTSPVAVWSAFLPVLAVAGACGLASRAKWRGKFVAVADADGVEGPATGNTRLRVRAQWPEIEKAVRIDNFNLFGTHISSQIEFRDGQGETRIQIPLSHAPQPQQEQFAGVVAQYLTEGK